MLHKLSSGLSSLLWSGDPSRLNLSRIKRALKGENGRIIAAYLASTSEPKLHVGGGVRLLDGWLNTDIALVPGVVWGDATKPLPYPNDTFCHIFSEHMIEHVTQAGGLAMLKEFFRTMRPGGVVRITTPDLKRLCSLFSDSLDAVQQQYVSWFCQTFTPGQRPPSATLVMNAQARLWGHQFLYDEATLREAMELAGFESVTRQCLGESNHVALKGLENSTRYPPGLLEFESVCLEGVKPGRVS